jgi:hypothetical protein
VVGNTGEAGLPVEAPEVDIHSHHWLIGKQDGPSSEGVCKGCGEIRDFTNGFSRSYPGTFRIPGSSTAPRA